MDEENPLHLVLRAMEEFLSMPKQFTGMMGAVDASSTLQGTGSNAATIGMRAVNEMQQATNEYPSRVCQSHCCAIHGQRSVDTKFFINAAFGVTFSGQFARHGHAYA